MSCRRLKKENGVHNIVWFGSYGIEPDIWIFNLNLNGMTGDAEFTDIEFVSRETIYHYLAFNFDKTSADYGIKIGQDSQNTESIYGIAGWAIQDRTLSFRNYGNNEVGLKDTLKICACHKSKFFNPDNKHDNYSYETDEVVDSLIQRLSVIRGELWYQIDHGLSLFKKYKSIGVLESEILTIINSHPKVKSVLSYTSSLSNNRRVYNFSAQILTIYNETIDFSGMQNILA